MSNKTNNRQAGRLVYVFGDFCLDLDRGTLSRDGQVVPLRPKCWAVLAQLVNHRGELVSRADLIDAVWHNASVSDDSLTQCIVEIRRAIGDDDRTMLRTVPRRGFVFEVDVTVHREADSGTDRSSALVVPGWRWAATAAGIAGLGALLVWMQSPPEPGAPTGARDTPPAVAVLPFADMTDAQDRQYFADGVAEEILNHLALIPELRVISRSSSFSLRDEQQDIGAIAERLGVDFILEGSVRGTDKHLRITAQLIEADTDAHVWAASYDRTVEGVNAIEVQADVAGNVAAAIGRNTGVSVSAPPERILTVSADAQDNYLRGMYYLRRVTTGLASKDVYENAIRHLKAAIAIEPEWVPAYAALGAALHFHATGAHVEPERIPDTFEESRMYLNEAVRLDPGFGRAYSSLAFIAHSYDQDFERAEALYAKANQLGSLSHWGYAIMMRSMGRLDESVEHYREALLHDPLSASIGWQLADALRCQGRYAEAAERVDELMEESPDAAPFLEFRAYLSARLGEMELAREITERHRETPIAPAFGATYALLGMRQDAESALEFIEAQPRWHPNLHSRVALQLGMEERALDYLEAVARDDPRVLAFIQCPDDVGPLVDNPRFKAILTDAGVPQRIAAAD